MFFYRFSPDFWEGCGSEQILLGSSVSKKPPPDDVERFLAMIQFENKGKLGEIPNLV